MGGPQVANTSSSPATFSRAEELMAAERWTEAIDDFLKILEEASQNDERTTRLQCFLGIARCQAAVGKWEACCASCTKCHVLMPHGSPAACAPLKLRLEANTKLGNNIAAMGDCLRIAETTSDPEEKARYTLLAKEYREKSHGSTDAGEEEEEYTGCQHYRRRCRLYCPDCGVLSNCRVCHDEKADHKLDRFKVSKIQCGSCGTDQPPEASCISCGIEFADYYCGICHLYCDRPADMPADFIWHCDKCGLCRKGAQGRSAYTHCDVCGSCWPSNSDHRCFKNSSTRANCPVCLEDMHSSRQQVSAVKCGHFMHDSCLTAIRNQGTVACPVCKKTIFPEFFAVLKAEIQVNKMPDEYKDVKAEIICNDCLKKSTVPFHFIAMQCSFCGSLNTTQTQRPLLVRQNQAEEGQEQPS